MVGPARRWRWRVTRLKGDDLVGEWQPTKDAAKADALARGQAKHDPEFGWFFDVFTTLEQEAAEPH